MALNILGVSSKPTNSKIMIPMIPSQMLFVLYVPSTLHVLKLISFFFFSSSLIFRVSPIPSLLKILLVDWCMWLLMFLFSSPTTALVSSFKSIFSSVRLSQRFGFPFLLFQLFSDPFPKEETNEFSQQSNTSSVTIDVFGVNNPPFSQSQAVETMEDTPVSITLEGSDADVEDQEDLIVYISALPKVGLLSQVPFFSSASISLHS